MCDLEHRVRLAKVNVDTMVSIMGGWSKTPLHRRKGNRKDALLNLEVRAEKLLGEIMVNSNGSGR